MQIPGCRSFLRRYGMYVEEDSHLMRWWKLHSKMMNVRSSCYGRYLEALGIMTRDEYGVLKELTRKFQCRETGIGPRRVLKCMI